MLVHQDGGRSSGVLPSILSGTRARLAVAVLRCHLRRARIDSRLLARKNLLVEFSSLDGWPAPVAVFENANHANLVSLGKGQNITNAHHAMRFRDPCPIDPDPPGRHDLRRTAPGLEEAPVPEPFVNSDCIVVQDARSRSNNRANGE